MDLTELLPLLEAMAPSAASLFAKHFTQRKKTDPDEAALLLLAVIFDTVKRDDERLQVLDKKLDMFMDRKRRGSISKRKRTKSRLGKT